MKCKLEKTSHKDMERLKEELRKLRCYKCGSVIKIFESPFFMVYEQQKKPLCERCKAGE